MRVHNQTNYLTDDIVEEYVDLNLNRLHASKHGIIQVNIPIGYLIIEVDDYDSVTVQLEHKEYTSV